MSFSKWIISPTDGQTMVYLFYTTIISVDLAQKKYFMLKFVISGKGRIMSRKLP